MSGMKGTGAMAVKRGLSQAYSSMCGVSVSGSSLSRRGWRLERGSGLSSRGFLYDGGLIRGRMCGAGGNWLMLSNVPIVWSKTGYPMAIVSAAGGET